MPRDLFGDVASPRVSVGNRKWYTVPLSLAAHVVAIVPLVLVPLLAADVLPNPYERDLFVAAMPVPPEPPAPPIRRVERTPQVNPNAAPTVAPSEIRPETGNELAPFEDAAPRFDGVLEGITTGIAPEPPPPPPAPAPPPQPVRVGPGVRTPVKMRDAAPVYPAIAQAARVEGTVILEAVISVDGRVEKLRVLRSVALLDQAASDAVRQWEYSPTLLNGVPVPVIMTVTVTFTLKK